MDEWEKKFREWKETREPSFFEKERTLGKKETKKVRAFEKETPMLKQIQDNRFPHGSPSSILGSGVQNRSAHKLTFVATSKQVNFEVFWVRAFSFLSCSTLLASLRRLAKE